MDHTSNTVPSADIAPRALASEGARAEKAGDGLINMLDGMLYSQNWLETLQQHTNTHIYI